MATPTKREQLKKVIMFTILVALMTAFGNVARAKGPLSAPLQAPPQGTSGLESSGLEKIAPQVLGQMQLLSKGEMLTVIVTLKEQANLNSLRVQGAPNRAFRNWAVVTELQSTANLSQRGLKALLGVRRAEGQVGQITYFWIFNGLAVTATPAIILELAAQPQVLKITPNETYQAPFAPIEQEQLSATANQPNLDLINVPALWAMGFKGQGVVIANTDTGVNLSHPDLNAKWRGGTNSWYDPYGQNPTSPVDIAGGSTGHGTQTMGIMVGDDDGGTAYGIAPDATWIAVKVFNNSGNGTVLAFHQGLQWLLDPDGNPATDDAPHVVNNSWIAVQGCNLEFQLDLQAMRAAGILPIFSAGNTAGATHSPANYPEAFAVGAVYNNDKIWESSSIGPSSCGESSTIYPEVVAPGVNIHTSNISPLYTNATGTSAAAPHVAGVLALLLSASPNLTVNQQQAALLNTVVDLGDTGPDNTFGYGRINVLAAYQAISANPVVYLPIIIK